jgi:hypothetical protein
MNRCIDCGKPVSAGRTQARPEELRCLICETAALFRGWYYPSTPAAQQRIRLKKGRADANGS